MNSTERFPEIRNYEGPYKSKLISLFGDFGKRVEISKEKYIMTEGYKSWQEKLTTFETRAPDVWVVSYPKSGTTWTQELVWCLLNDFQLQGSTDTLMKKFPHFEWETICPETFMEDIEADHPWHKGQAWKNIQELKDPRAFKSHLHLDLLPSNIFTSGAKIIYVFRDPRDVLVSYHYHNVNLAGFAGDFQDSFDLFVEDLHVWSPYWKHVLNFWNKRRSSNLLLIRYEELQEDRPKVIQRVADFLGRQITNEYIKKLTEHLSFSKMRSNANANNEDIPAFLNQKVKFNFLRKGKVGDWKAHFTTENTEVFRKWTEENLKGSDFPYYQDYE